MTLSDLERLAREATHVRIYRPEMRAWVDQHGNVVDTEVDAAARGDITARPFLWRREPVAVAEPVQPAAPLPVARVVRLRRKAAALAALNLKDET